MKFPDDIDNAGKARSRPARALWIEMQNRNRHPYLRWVEAREGLVD